MANEREIWERFGEVERKLKLLYEHLDLDMPEEPEPGEVSEEVLPPEANQTVEGLRGKV